MPESTLKVSVIISTFNRAQYLKRSVESVLNQTFQDFELIIVDNASTDQTQSFIQSLTDQRISTVRHGTNKGGSAARNTGIKLARGNFIAFLDDDDEWLPEKLSKQVQAFENASKEVGLVYAGSEFFDDTKQRLVGTNHPSCRGHVYQRLLLSTVIGSVTSVMVRKECLDKAGMFDEELTSCQDWEMWLRIARHFEFDYVPDILARIHVHGEQISTNYQALIPGRTRMVQKHYDEFKAYPEILVVHLKRLGKLHCINGTYKEAWPWFQQAINVRPLEVIKIIAWCLLELPRVKFFSPAKVFKRYSPKA